MNKDLQGIKEQPRRASMDYLQLMHEALEKNDKEWFEELARKKAQLEEQEQSAREELGWKGE